MLGTQYHGSYTFTRSQEGSTRPISMPESRTTVTCMSEGGAAAKWGVLKCVSCHFRLPSGSADFLSEIANRRVKMGLKLGSEREDQLLMEEGRRIG